MSLPIRRRRYTPGRWDPFGAFPGFDSLFDQMSQMLTSTFRDVPQIDVEIIDRKGVPSAGAGETPIVGLAPAVGNAIFSATGIRLRALPMLATGIFDQHQQAASRKS